MLDHLKEAIAEAKRDYAQPGRAEREKKARERARKRRFRLQVSKLAAVRAGDVVDAIDRSGVTEPPCPMIRQACAAGSPDREVLIDLEILEKVVSLCSTSSSSAPKKASSTETK